MSWRFAADTGGTFTDLVGVDPATGEWLHCKVDSNKQSPDAAVVCGVRDLAQMGGISLDQVDVLLHGTTVATNAVLERTGAKVALITTEGFRDILEIQRQNRPRLYDLRTRRESALVPRSLRLEIRERILFNGAIELPPNRQDVEKAADVFNRSGVDAVVIGLINSYANPENEALVGKWVRELCPGIVVCMSHQIGRSLGEYERFSTSVLNAYVHPIVNTYIGRLFTSLREAGTKANLLIMKSNGGVTSPQGIEDRNVETLLSGPAGGVIAASQIARHHSNPNIITADMGGTSFDVSVIRDAEPMFKPQATINGLAVFRPMIDIHTVDAGGGSIAWVDAGGALRVGPRSAGASPGPACYGRGGTLPTVTDANLVLGRLGFESSLGGDKLKLDLELAQQTISEHVARPLGMSVIEAADGIIKIANARMTAAIRKLTIERGYAPSGFSLCVFGGAGPLHGAELAREMGAAEVLVPRWPGVMSAFGLLLAQVRDEEISSCQYSLTEADSAAISDAFNRMQAQCSSRVGLVETGDTPTRIHRHLYMRYRGQGHELVIDASDDRLDIASLTEEFHREHRRQFGYAFADQSIEIVNLWLAVSLDLESISLPQVEPLATPKIKYTRDVYFDGEPRRTPVYNREDLGVGFELIGPAILDQADSTVVVLPGQVVQVDKYGQLLLRFDDAVEVSKPEKTKPLQRVKS